MRRFARVTDADEHETRRVVPGRLQDLRNPFAHIESAISLRDIDDWNARRLPSGPHRLHDLYLEGLRYRPRTDQMSVDRGKICRAMICHDATASCGDFKSWAT